MKVADIMTRRVRTCRSEDTLNVPAKLMWDHDFGCVPAVDSDGRVVGLITDRDICMAAYTTGRSLADLRVGEVMCTRLAHCQPTDSVEAAERLMREKQIRRVPVVEDNRLVGMLSLNDVAVAGMSGKTRRDSVSAQEVGETLAAICSHRPEVTLRAAPPA